MSKGFVSPLIIGIIVLVLAIAGGAFYVGKIVNSPPDIVPVITTAPKPSPTLANKTTNPDSIGANWKTYTNDQFGFRFKYPTDSYKLINDDEKQSSQRSHVDDIKQGFRSIMKQEPPTVLGAVSLQPLDKKKVSPFSVWVFENKEEKNIDNWFDKYWYYPHNFAQAIESIVQQSRPNNLVQIGNYQAKYGEPGGMFVTQYIYVTQGKRMVLIEVLGKLDDQEIGSQIFSTFKFQ